MIDRFRNRFLILALMDQAMTQKTKDRESSNILAALANVKFHILGTQAMETTWRALAEVESSAGIILMSIPMWDERVLQLVSGCKSQDTKE